MTATRLLTAAPALTAATAALTLTIYAALHYLRNRP